MGVGHTQTVASSSHSQPMTFHTEWYFGHIPHAVLRALPMCGLLLGVAEQAV